MTQLNADVGDVKAGTFGGSYCESGYFSYYVVCPKCGRERPILAEHWDIIEFQDPNLKISRASKMSKR
jgi:hypothetical protein